MREREHDPEFSSHVSSALLANCHAFLKTSVALFTFRIPGEQNALFLTHTLDVVRHCRLDWILFFRGNLFPDCEIKD